MSISRFAFALPRPMIAAILALTIAPAALLATAPPAAEARTVWCSGDPAILVNGHFVSVTGHLPWDRLDDVDHVEFVFHVPEDAETAVVIDDAPFFDARATIVNDGPATSGDRFASFTVVVDIIVYHDGEAFEFGATTVTSGKGGPVLEVGNSALPLTFVAFSR